MCSSGSTRCSWKFVFLGRFLLSFFLMQCERCDVANYTHEARGWSEKDRWCPRTKKNSASSFLRWVRDMETQTSSPNKNLPFQTRPASKEICRCTLLLPHFQPNTTNKTTRTAHPHADKCSKPGKMPKDSVPRTDNPSTSSFATWPATLCLPWR